MAHIPHPDNINEERTCVHCSKLYLYINEKFIDEDTNEVVSTNSRNAVYCPHCGELHVIVKAPSGFEARPTIKGGGRELLNRIKQRNYGSTMPDY